MIKIQIALQGGGAKFMALLAAMEVVEELERRDQPVLKVTRLAGTSAGSIAACLFAAGFSMREVRLELQGEFGKKVLAAFPAPTPYKIARQNYSGKAVWDTEILRSWLSDKFEKAKIIRFRDLREKRRPADVVSTDLRTGGTKTYGDDDNIVEAILDSCAIPFFFRSWKVANTGSLYVDGGICENLPIWDLKAREKEFENGEPKWGKPIAFSFVPEIPGLPKNVCDFSRALLGTAIDNSVHRAKRALGEDSVHEIETFLKTFDFSNALTPGDTIEKEYDAIRGKAREFLNRIARQSHVQDELHGYHWDETNLPLRRLQQDLGRACTALYGGDNRKYIHLSFTTTGNCLLTGNSREIVAHKSTFASVKAETKCSLTELVGGLHTLRLKRTKWEVLDDTNKPIPVIDIPVRDPNHSNRCAVTLFYLDPVPTGRQITEKFEEEIQVSKAELTDLSFGLQHSKPDGPIKVIDLVLFVPKKLPGVTLRRGKGSPNGKEMNGEQLKEYPPPSQEYYALGWRGENVEIERGGFSFSAEICLPGTI